MSFYFVDTTFHAEQLTPVSNLTHIESDVKTKHISCNGLIAQWDFNLHGYMSSFFAQLKAPLQIQNTVKIFGVTFYLIFS